MTSLPLAPLWYAPLVVLVLASALWVVTLPNLFRAALSLGLVLAGVAGIFLLLGAEFLAFVQILVYVGAILTLVVFAIMLTAKLHVAPQASASRHRGPAALVSAALFGLLVSVAPALPGPTAGTGDVVTADVLGQQFITALILPFEVVSLVLVAALVGAVAIAVKPKLPRG